MFRTPSRRLLAREALDRLESRELGARLGEEGALAELARLQARDVELGRRMRAMQERLDDANAELRRWGLEPVLREEPESDDHPTRYRRSADWRLTDFAHVSTAIAAIAPDGIDVEIDDAPDAPAVSPLEAPVDDRLAALRRMRDDAIAQRDELAAAVATLTAERDALREELELERQLTNEAEAAVRNGATGLADALAEERTEREQAERSRDRAQSLNLDLQRWREKERDALAAFVEVLADAAQAGSLHADLQAPFARAFALIEDPDA
jgi:hypothetical protein